MVKFRAEEGLDYGGVARYEFDTKLKAEHEIKISSLDVYCE